MYLFVIVRLSLMRHYRRTLPVFFPTFLNFAVRLSLQLSTPPLHTFTLPAGIAFLLLASFVFSNLNRMPFVVSSMNGETELAFLELKNLCEGRVSV